MSYNILWHLNFVLVRSRALGGAVGVVLGSQSRGSVPPLIGFVLVDQGGSAFLIFQDEKSEIIALSVWLLQVR